MVNLAQKWAEVYMQKNPNVSNSELQVVVQEPVWLPFKWPTDLANSSRELKEE